eukprot:TRINITY_DN58444_c0_g1_i1.p1 TRINITY_DN58444_c0_g1~~TRINITY_DN58444_c0_g1_i1.p1  ORF type:complete len:414 (-),score=55.27 TRINITY_DN58444_c0_g1_i1:117-1358(-)
MAPLPDGQEDAVCKRSQHASAALVRHAILNVVVRDLTLQTEVELFACMGDAAQTASYMSAATTCAGLGEFLFNPLVARLSDCFGRSLFLNLLNTYSIIGNTVLSLNPMAKVGKVPFVVINRALTGMLSTHSGSVMGTISMSDFSTGPALGINLARMFGAFGVGTIIGPCIGNRAFGAGGFRAVYRIRALVALAHLLHNCFTMPETLPLSIPFRAEGLNPFGFIKLLASPDGPLLSRLSRAILICTSEQKILINLKTLWLKENIGLSITQAQRELMAYATSTWLSGQFLAPRIIRTFGASAFTDLTAVLNALAFGIWGASSSVVGLWLGLLLHVPGCNGTGASMVKADMITRAEQLGIRRAEINAHFMNLRAMLVTIVPMLLGRLYAALVPSGHGERAWYLLASFAASSLLLRR